MFVRLIRDADALPPCPRGVRSSAADRRDGGRLAFGHELSETATSARRMNQRDAGQGPREVRNGNFCRTVNRQRRDALPWPNRGAPIFAAQVQQFEIGLDRSKQSVDARFSRRSNVETGIACSFGRRIPYRVSLQPSIASQRRACEAMAFALVNNRPSKRAGSGASQSTASIWNRVRTRARGRARVLSPPSRRQQAPGAGPAGVSFRLRNASGSNPALLGGGAGQGLPLRLVRRGRISPCLQPCRVRLR